MVAPAVNLCIRKVLDFRYEESLEREQRNLITSGVELGINHFGLYSGLINGVFGGKRGIPKTEAEELWGFDLSSFPDKKFFSLHPQKESAPSMQWLVENLIVPQTEAKKTAFIDHFLGLLHNGRPVVGQANVFHSYTWGESIKDTLNAIDRSVSRDKKPCDGTTAALATEQESLYFWIDFFCQNQHVKGDIQANIFRAIKQCEQFYVSIPHLLNPKALTRVWCIFELGAAIGENKKLEVINADMNQEELIVCVDKELESFIVNTRDAQATVPSDKEIVLSFLEEQCGGIDHINSTVNKAIADLIRPTILREAAKLGLTDAVSKLVTIYNTNVNMVDVHGASPLHYAVTFYRDRGDPDMMQKKLETTRVLLENGADVSIEDRAGRKAFERAGSSEIGALIASYKQK